MTESNVPKEEVTPLPPRFYVDHQPSGPYKINDRSSGRLASAWNRATAEMIVAALNAWSNRP